MDTHPLPKAQRKTGIIVVVAGTLILVATAVAAIHSVFA
jgi:hypothetical protein